jgi:hypothetical protein
VKAKKVTYFYLENRKCQCKHGICKLWTIFNHMAKQHVQLIITLQTQTASELCRPRDRRLSEKLVPTFSDRWCHEVSATDPQGHTLDYLDRSPYFFFQAAAQLYSQGWVDPHSRPSTSHKIWQRRESNPGLWICSQELWPPDHRGGQKTLMQHTIPRETFLWLQHIYYL